MFISKKLLSVVLTGTMLLGFAACGSSNNNVEESKSATTTTEDANQNNEKDATKDDAAKDDASKKEDTSKKEDSSKEASTDNKDDKDASKSEDGKIHIKYRYARADKIGESKQELVKKFNESQDEVVVEAEYQGSYADQASKTQAAMAAGNPPEVFESEVAVLYTMAKGGLLQDLTDFVDDKLDIEDFNKGLMREAYVDDKLYGIPFYRSTPILYKNVTMLKEAGLDPKGPRDWKEFKEYLAALRNKDKGVYGLSFQMDPRYLEAFTLSSDGYFVKDGKIALNGEGSKEMAHFLQDITKEDLVKVPVGETAGDTVKQDFVNQKSAFLFTSTADLSYFLPLAEENGFDLDVSFVPKNKEYAVPTGGANIVMVNGLSKEKQDAAWKFIEWATATDQTAFSSEYTGYLPTRYSALKTEKIQNLYKERPQFKVAVDQLEYAKQRPIANGWPEMSKLLHEAIITITTQGADVDSTLDGLQKQAESILTF